MKDFSQTRIFVLIMRNNDIVLFCPVVTSTNQVKPTFSQIDFNIDLMLIAEYTRVENKVEQ